MTIDYRGPKCGCGKYGCIEALASGPAIAARARAVIATAGPRGARLAELAGENLEALHSEDVAAAWRAGDPLAAEILAERMDLLAIWLGNIIDLLEPNVIIFGGGIGELASEWFGHIRSKLPAWCIIKRGVEIPLVLARYVADTGIAGAAALCLAPASKA